MAMSKSSQVGIASDHFLAYV